MLYCKSVTLQTWRSWSLRWWCLRWRWCLRRWWCLRWWCLRWSRCLGWRWCLRRWCLRWCRCLRRHAHLFADPLSQIMHPCIHSVLFGLSAAISPTCCAVQVESAADITHHRSTWLRRERTYSAPDKISRQFDIWLRLNIYYDSVVQRDLESSRNIHANSCSEHKCMQMQHTLFSYVCLYISNNIWLHFTISLFVFLPLPESPWHASFPPSG